MRWFLKVGIFSMRRKENKLVKIEDFKSILLFSLLKSSSFFKGHKKKPKVLRSKTKIVQKPTHNLQRTGTLLVFVYAFLFKRRLRVSLVMRSTFLFLYPLFYVEGVLNLGQEQLAQQEIIAAQGKHLF